MLNCLLVGFLQILTGIELCAGWVPQRIFSEVSCFMGQIKKRIVGKVKGKSYFSLPRHPNANQFTEIHCESVIYGNFLDLIFTRVFFNKLVERRAGFKCFCLPHGKE